MIQKTYTFEKNEKINEVYTLSNANGYEVDILTYGARIIRVWTPDKKGRLKARIQVSGKDVATGKLKVFVKKVYNDDGLTLG